MASYDAASEAKRLMFEQLAHAHFRGLWASALCITRGEAKAAEALLLATLVRGYQALDGHTDDDGFRDWLVAVMVRTYLQSSAAGNGRERRSALGRAPADAPDDRSDAWPGHGPELRRRLDALADDLRLPLLLCDMEGFSYAQIGRLLSLPVGAVRARVFRALRQLLQPSVIDESVCHREEAPAAG